MTNLFFKMNYSSFRGTNNFSKELGMKNLFVYQFLLANSDYNRRCNLSQRQLSELTGMSLPTINKILTDLLSFRLNGKPILTAQKFKNLTVYQIRNNPYVYVYEQIGEPDEAYGVSDSSSDKGRINKKYEVDMTNPCGIPLKNDDDNCLKNLNNEPDKCLKNLNKVFKKFKHLKEEENKELKELKDLPDGISNEGEFVMKTPKDIIVYFTQQVEELTHISLKPVWGRDMNIVKRKFIPFVKDFESKDVKRFIQILVINHKRWTTNDQKYPLSVLTLGTDWLLEKALEEFKNEQKEAKNIEEKRVQYEQQQAPSRLLSLFGED